jgi:hypothetical protein
MQALDALTSQALKPLMVLHGCGLTRFKLFAARITAPNSERASRSGFCHTLACAMLMS